VTGHNTAATVIILLGLFIQIVSFGLFYQSIRRSPTTRCVEPGIPWEGEQQMLFAVNVLIMVRSVSGVTEFAMGNEEYLLRHEWAMYILDSVPMLVVMVVSELDPCAGWSGGSVRVAAPV
jgi:hypothetical protein